MDMNIKLLLVRRSAVRFAGWVLGVVVAIPCLSYGQWVPLGPSGGGIQVLTSLQSDPATLIAATRNAFLYRSRDKGASWQPIHFPRSLHATLNALILDPCDASTIFVGVSDFASLSGLYKTVNGGKDWAAVKDMEGESVTALAAAPYVCGTIAAGTSTGVMVSPDGGASWKRISPADHPGLHPVVSLAFDTSSTDIVYAGTPKLPWKTSNGGKTWESIHLGIQDDSDIFSIVPYGSRILIGACSGVYRSIDGGAKWTKVLGIPGTSRRTYVVKPDPTNLKVLYAGTSQGLYKSIDGGATWTRKSDLPVRGITIDVGNSRNLVLATDTGILKSANGGDILKPSNAGFSNRKLEAFEDTGTGLLASAAYEVGSGNRVFMSADGGRHWTSPAAAGSPPEPILGFATLPRSVFAASAQKIYRADRQTKVWLPLKRGFKGTITALEAIPRLGSLAATTTDELFVSKDDGATWLNVDLPSAIKGIRLLRFSPDGKTWGIGTRDGVFISGDKGATWGKLKTPEQNGLVHDFALHTKNAILIGTLRGLAYSSDGGLRWQTSPEGLNSGTVESVLWHPVNKNLMFAVQNGFAYKSSDGGATWDRVRTDELEGDSILNLHWASDHLRLYAVTVARGIFVQNLSLASSVVNGGSKSITADAIETQGLEP
jgi:photosystem II stability/assembly factor-like uncharacterized protein